MLIGQVENGRAETSAEERNPDLGSLTDGGKREEKGRDHPRRPQGPVKRVLDVQIDVSESVKPEN